MNIQSKIYPKSLKMEARGGSGGSRGRPGRHFGPKTVQGWKKVVRWPLSGSPFGSLFGHFSAHDRFRSSFCALFSYMILRFVFLSIVGEFRIRNWGIFESGRHAASVVNSVQIRYLLFFRQVRFLIPPGSLPGSLFEVMLAPKSYIVRDKSSQKSSKWPLKNNIKKSVKKSHASHARRNPGVPSKNCRMQTSRPADKLGIRNTPLVPKGTVAEICA